MIIIEHLDPRNNFHPAKIAIDPVKTGLHEGDKEAQLFDGLQELINKGDGYAVPMSIGLPNGEQLDLPHVVMVALTEEKERRTEGGIILKGNKYG